MNRRVVVGVGLCLAIAVAVMVRNHRVDPARKEAQAACTTYADISGRHQVAATRVETDDLIASTVEHATEAAALDARWNPLRADIESYLRWRQDLPRATDALSRRYFIADWHVEGDCSLAGRAIGDLTP